MSWKERKALAADLKLIYRAATAEMAELALAAFRAKYPNTTRGCIGRRTPSKMSI